MATATKETSEVTYVLRMNKREANALTELVLAANHVDGEGELFADIYEALTSQGCESDLCTHEIDTDKVAIFREEQ